MLAAVDGAPRLVWDSAGMHTLAGQLAGFNPADPSVDSLVPAGPRGPFALFVFGDSGGDNSNAETAMHDLGDAVLGFDAYRMDGFVRPAVFWIRSTTCEAWQQVIYTMALGHIVGS